MRLLRKGDDPVTIALTMLAMTTLAATLIVLIVVPKPSTDGLQHRYERRWLSLRRLNIQAADDLKAKQRSVVAQTWNIPEQKVGPWALSNVTALVRRNNLRLVSFRPQRRNEEGPFVQLPYLLTVEGPFPSVLALGRQLEQPATKLAVGMIQLASAEESTDRVTASIGLVAYMSPKVEEVPTHG